MGHSGPTLTWKLWPVPLDFFTLTVIALPPQPNILTTLCYHCTSKSASLCLPSLQADQEAQVASCLSSGYQQGGKAAAELPAPVKLCGLVSSSRGKSEQGPATRSLGNACTKIQLIKSASYLFHGHFHLGHCRRDLFTAGNQQQRVIQQGKLKLSWRHWPVATDTSYTHTRGTHPTAEVSGATHTTSDSKYVSCPSDLLLYLLPLAARSPKADHVLASQLSGSKHFALLKCPLEAGLSGMRTCVQCKAAGMAQTSCSCENTQFTNCLNMAVR